MPSTLSLRKHNRNLNEWVFSFTADNKNKLDLAVENLKKIHQSRLSTSRIIEDPDVAGYYMFCGICENEQDMNLVLLFMENQFHEDIPRDSQYWEEIEED